ncbi:MAG: rod shape-determining protein MreC, partial [Solirubrobacterales bacterium]
VTLDDPVINGDGLVGRISSVSRGTSIVTLITDSSSAVTAKVLPGGAQGVIRPRLGSPGQLILEFLDETNDIRPGQAVVTSGWRSDGLSSLFPPNLPVGDVERAPIDEREAIQTVEISPYPDLRNLDLLQVLTGGNRG